MRKTNIGILLAALLSLAGVSGAKAQTIESPYRFIDKKRDLGLFVSYMFTDRGTADLGPSSGPLAGGEFSLRLSNPINLGVYVAYFPSERDVIDPSTENTQQVIGTADLNLLLIAGRLKMYLTGSRTWHRLVPYFYGAAGIAFDVTSTTSCLVDANPATCKLTARERFDFGTSFLGQIGFALLWLPKQRLGLRITIDNTIWRLTTPDGFYDDGATVNPIPPKKDWTNNIQLALGAYYFF